MTNLMPADAPALMKSQAELDTYRFIVQRLVSDHDRMAQRSGFPACLCSSCQAARPFIPVEPRYCDQMDEREAVS